MNFPLSNLIRVPDWRRAARPGVSLAAAGAPVQAAPAPATPALATIVRPEARQAWLGSNLTTYTPQYIEQILRSALGGSLQEQWILFGLMEDTWPRLSKNLNKLKRAVV